MDAVQQLEVALLGSAAAGLIDLLTERLQQPSYLKPNVQPLQVYTSSTSAPPPQMIPTVGLNTPLPEKTSDEKTDRIATMAPHFQEAPPDNSKNCCITPTPASILEVPLTSSTSSYLIVIVPELVILAEANPELVNRPGGAKIISVISALFSTPTMIVHWLTSENICGQGIQNAALLHKHRKKVHQIWIVTSAEEQ